MWDKETIRIDLGLSRRGRKQDDNVKIKIDKGEIDPRSHGGMAMISKADLDPDRNLKDLEIRYWVIYPDGRYEKQVLFELEMEKLESGGLDIKNLWVLGRLVPPGERNTANVMEAIRRLHVSLRSSQKELPHIAQIFKECDLENIIGEKLPLPGFHLKQRIYFPASRDFNIRASGTGEIKMILPKQAFNPLRGIRRNTLDRDHSYKGRNGLPISGVIDATGKRFQVESTLTKVGTVDRKLTLIQVARNSMAANDNPRILAEADWEKEEADSKHHYTEDVVRVKTLNLLGRNALREGFRKAMGALGVLNLTHADMLNGDYPRMQDHLATHGFLDMTQSSSPAPDENGRLVITSLGGDNIREIYPGVGLNIGGNCKIAETQWFDKKNYEVKKIGAIFDIGLFLLRNRSEWTAAMPDVVEKLSYCKDIFISHHHLDHLDGVVAYIKRGLIGPQHTLHMTPEVHEMLHKKLNKIGVKKYDPRRPKINFLTGTGKVDLKDEDGVTRMTVMYGADAVPHTARNTPYTVIGRDGKIILGSYTYIGDSRFDKDWFRTNPSKFWDPVAMMHEYEPDLNPDHLIPTRVDLEATSIKKPGHAPTEADVRKNLSPIIKNWLFDLHVGISVIGTSDGRRESLLCINNETQRKMTAFGSAVEDLFAISNKWGVNPYLVPRPASGHYTGNKDYLEWHAKLIGVKPTKFFGRTSKEIQNSFRDDPPGTLFAVLSGSQGNPIEFESTTYKISDGRSLFDADPLKSKTARPADLENWAFIFSQGAIPGNEKYQRELVLKLARRGAMVIQPEGEGIRIFNAREKVRERILADLKKNDKIFDIDSPDQSILVENMPIHASGHMWNGDLRLWLKKIPGKSFNFCHYDDRESLQVGYQTLEEEGKVGCGPFGNFTEVQVTNDGAFEIGKITPSVVMLKEEAEEGKHYNKNLRASRFINYDSTSAHHALGLSASHSGPFETHVGAEDMEREVKRIRKKAEFNENAHDIRRQSRPRRPYRSFRPRISRPPDWGNLYYSMN